MSIQVKIIKGYYRGKLITDTVFPLVKPWKSGAGGGFVSVRNPAPEDGHPPVQRITCEPGDFQLLDAVGEALGEHIVVAGGDAPGTLAVDTDYERVFIDAETEDEAMDRIKSTFTMLDKITDSCAKGIIRGLVVAGPPGVGKSFGVEKQLAAANLFRTLRGDQPYFEVISGGVSPIGLFQKLYYNRNPEQVIMFDDCDGILFEEECLTLLKAALNSGDRRKINWNKESRTLKSGDIPDSFDFEGSIIFLSNVDFEVAIAKQSRIASHLAAIMSRCHYMDLEIGSLRDRLLRIKQVVRDGMLASYQFTPDEEKAVLDFVVDNQDHLREVSLRMCKKVADFVKSDPTEWYEMAEATLLKREAKFKRLHDKRMKIRGAVQAGTAGLLPDAT